MKKILITGANSYIGISFENYMKQWPDKYQVDTIDMIDGSWREKSFSGYETVFHVAGIAHQKETKKNAPLYYRVNRDLAIEAAKKAKEESVKQFVFLSSMSVYGIITGKITRETTPTPKSNYGKSKLEAEYELNRLVSDDFIVSVLRPPMVYGKGCKGNFQNIVKIVKILPVFPKVNNCRSMIYIDNLCEYVKQVIDGAQPGIYCPQNNELVNTSDMAKIIGVTLGKKIYLSRALGTLVSVGSIFSSMLIKAYGSLVYETKDYPQNNIGFEDSIKKSL